MKHVYADASDVFERATSKDHLSTRLQLNRRYQSTDFDAWLMARLAARPGEHVMDVGCGEGAQSIPLLKAVGDTGSVSALDISAQSVDALLQKAGGATNIVAVAEDMANLQQVIDRSFSCRMLSASAVTGLCCTT